MKSCGIAWGEIHRKKTCARYQSLKCAWKVHLENYNHISILPGACWFQFSSKSVTWIGAGLFEIPKGITFSKIWIEMQTFENGFCKMAVILCRPQWINFLWPNVMPYGDRDLGQHWFRYRNNLLPDSTKPLPQPNIDNSLLRLCCIHVWRISQSVPKIFIQYNIFKNDNFKFIVTHRQSHWVNSSPPSDPYMRQWIGSALVQIMACRLISAKPLSEPMLEYCYLEQTSVKFESKYKTFHSWKCIWK